MPRPICNVPEWSATTREIKGAKDTLDDLYRLLRSLPRDPDLLTDEARKGLEEGVLFGILDAIADLEAAMRLL